MAVAVKILDEALRGKVFLYNDSTSNILFIKSKIF